MSHKEVFYGVSSYNCKNTKLFSFVEDAHHYGETLLQYRTRKDGESEEMFIGLPIETQADGSIDMFSLMLVQELWETNEHAKAADSSPKIYFL